MSEYKRLPLPGQSLAEQHLNIASEWNYEKNYPLLPEQFFPKSAQKVFWKCKHCGNSWPALIYSRTNGSGCPYCAGKIPIPGKTDLSTLYPEIADEWDCELNEGVYPEQCTTQSHKMVAWKCKKCGNRWNALIQNRTKGHGCPYCSGRLPIPGKTDLATLFPEIATEWDYDLNNPKRPEQFTSQSNKSVSWKCRVCGNTWSAAVYSRIKGHGCPYCAGRFPIPGKTDLATLFPEIATEWDYDLNNPKRPEQFTSQSNKSVSWKCRVCGNTWSAAVYSRIKGHGCPYCASYLPVAGKTDLATLYPQIADEWDEQLNGMLRPDQVSAHSRKMVTWRCKKCGNSWNSRVYHRTSGSGCTFCAGLLPITGKNDLKTLFPQIAIDWDYELNKKLKPEQVTAYSGRKVAWKCALCGHRWKISIIQRTHGSRCPHCQ